MSDAQHKGVSSSDVYVWLDIFAITQHPGSAQAHDLSMLEATIAMPGCTTLVVLDDTLGRPLTRCWCMFEIYATFQHANGRHGKLQVRAGTATATGDFVPCSDRESLCALADCMDASRTEASSDSDKAMLLSRLSEFGSAERDGLHEFNRKLQRAVRHGWT